MEPPDREYIATLCALSTVAASATGLAFGFRDNGQPPTPNPAKRKIPGTSSSFSHIQSLPARTSSVRRIVSQPVPETKNLEIEDSRPPHPTSRSFLRRRPLAASDNNSSNASTSTVSRDSSVSHHRRLRSRAGGLGDDGTDSSSLRPSWLRRISMISSLSGSPASSRPETPAASLSAASTGPYLFSESEIAPPAPNKLVKRSVSQRALSTDHTYLPVLRRPNTSHQRSADLRRQSVHDYTRFTGVEGPQIWRPYFNINQISKGGFQPRKRHTSGAVQESNIKTVSDVRGMHPTLLRGTDVAPREEVDDVNDNTSHKAPAPGPLTRRKLRVSSRGKSRVVTDPVLRPDPVAERSPLESRTSPLSPFSRVSTFDISLPSGTPAFSDPTTASSDKVFTDDDSMDFHSDTAYDSLATRATASSHSGLRGLQIDSVFSETGRLEHSNTLVGLEELIQAGSLDKRLNGEVSGSPQFQQAHISFQSSPKVSSHQHPVSYPPLSSTPPDADINGQEDQMATPVPRRIKKRSFDLDSSPPTIVTPRPNSSSPLREVAKRIEALKFAEGEPDWNHSSDSEMESDETSMLPDMPASPLWNAHFRHPELYHKRKQETERPSDNKPSIFDWSEHQKSGNDMLNGSSPRPKTVHGKQGAELRGSRTTGRRGPSAMHLRSQSVPVTRDMTFEIEPGYSSAKYGTWGLGNKGVSEEWSDDFEFEDNGSAGDGDTINANGFVVDRGSMRVPQSIIDRQASVHGQFGQVQEFMLLVEELKRLRQQASSLQILDSQSWSLWEDAESIVNLATLNDEDDNDEIERPQSPVSQVSFDHFDDDTSPPSHGTRKLETNGIGHRTAPSNSRRSTSNPATPPTGRPRGESLAHAKNLLQNIHQRRNGPDSSPANMEIHEQRKLPFDTQDLRDLVTRAGIITRALKDIVRKAEGVSVSPNKSPKPFQDPRDPPFSQIFNRPDSSPSPSSSTKPGIPKSRSANSYLGGIANGGNENDFPGQMTMLTVV